MEFASLEANLGRTFLSHYSFLSISLLEESRHECNIVAWDWGFKTNKTKIQVCVRENGEKLLQLHEQAASSIKVQT